ncbi:MAG: hypothetical protein IH842_06465 [Thaumarchaeota archaeon]|jgi:hypothetical protein|nr:hypothetical protein [Nitrososphaerota archaeon]MCH8324592.1 hypothetical protein [Nitrososphaerota archaeon]GFN41670.1 MAG: hypothetical protein YK1312THETA_1570018 [Marine Group I thaumarchaeote]
MDKIRTFRDSIKQEYKLAIVEDQQIESETIWNTLHEFGISKEDIMKQNLSHEELYNIHVAVKTYQDCQKVLKGLEEY